MKITSNLTQNTYKTQKAQDDKKKLVFQKKQQKMQTCINPY